MHQRRLAVAGMASLNLILLLAASPVAHGEDFTTPFPLSTMPSPVSEGAADLRVATRADGSPVVMWWETGQDERAKLFASVREKGGWSIPSLVTEGVNLVDAQMVATGNQGLGVLWMVAGTPPPGDEEVHEIYAARGELPAGRWTKPVRLNQETPTSAKESPAVTSLPDGTLLAAWIDQRHYRMIPPAKPGEEMTEEGYSSLMVTSLGADNRLGKELTVDTNFCSCCPPALVGGGQNGFLSYREHLPGNVRDPALLQVTPRNYGKRVIVHDDHWVLDGCPSRGSALARSGKVVATAWLTVINDKPRIRMSFSKNGGKKFDPPIDLDVEKGSGICGIELEDPRSAIVAWTTTSKGEESIRLARVREEGRVEHRTVVHSLTGKGNYKYPGPRIAKTNEGTVVAWNNEPGKTSGLVLVHTAP